MNIVKPRLSVREKKLRQSEFFKKKKLEQQTQMRQQIHHPRSGQSLDLQAINSSCQEKYKAENHPQPNVVKVDLDKLNPYRRRVMNFDLGPVSPTKRPRTHPPDRGSAHRRVVPDGSSLAWQPPSSFQSSHPLPASSSFQCGQSAVLSSKSVRRDILPPLMPQTKFLPTAAQNLPNIEKLALFLTDHIDPKSIMPSGYLQRAKKQLQDQYKASMNFKSLQKMEEKMEEDKENLESDAQMKPGPSQAIRRTQTHGLPFQALENTEDAPAAAFWWSSAEDKRLNIPPPASGPPPYRDTTWPNPSSAHTGNIKDLWSTDDGPMRNHADVSKLLIDPTDPKSLLELNNLMYHHHQSRSCPAASIPPLGGLGLPPFINANPADSGPSSSEWAVDLDRGCPRYIQQSTRKNSSFPPYFNQTDGECDILDIADTDPISTSDNVLPTMVMEADSNEEDRAESVGGLLSLKSSYSPSPEQKYYRRKVF